ncbi:MAG: tetratricopeptide repeat-containing serine/threonine-protein kinase [Sandaracinaceae bacterium]|nr:tetratricopeptide repeat-containing serine/threonine-protein kinase [Sandaracinaceae bacterium]
MASSPWSSSTGESLAARLERTGRLGTSRAVEIARAICAGVGAAHASGVVHRDLKPDNVLLAKDGRVVVTDFGIARAAAEGSRTVGVVGTPAYMAPEQIDERATIDHRADVYAFGAMLYEMLVGEPAWKADSLWALAAARLLNPPPDPRAKQPDLPAELAELVLACMARDPATRVSSMDEIDRALSRVALPTSTTPTPQTLPAGLAMAAHEKRVAVLPFANLGPADQEYVADGLTEDLIDVLSVARGLRVRSRGMVMSYKGSARDPREVGRELDVQAVVEGSVRRSAGGFRVNARVISVADGFQLWARRFDVPESELLTQNDAIAQAVADALTVKLAAPERSAADPRAVDLYLQARAAYHGSFSGDSARARRLFDELLALTPDDPRALAGRAMTGAHQPFWDEAGRRIVFETAERAIALAPTLPDGYVAKACALVFEGDYVAALAAGRQAVALAPEDAAARDVIGRILAEADHDDARLHLEAAIALEPRFEFPYIALLTHYHHRGELERVEALLESLRTQNPRFAPLMEARFVFWRRDAARGAALLETLDTRHPQEQLARGWLELLVHGPSSPEPSFGLPPAPPGAAIPPSSGASRARRRWTSPASWGTSLARTRRSGGWTRAAASTSPGSVTARCSPSFARCRRWRRSAPASRSARAA